MKPRISIKLPEIHVEAEGRRDVDKAIHFLNLLNLLETDYSVTQKDMKRLTPEHRHHIVRAISLRQIRKWK